MVNAMKDLKALCWPPRTCSSAGARLPWQKLRACSGGCVAFMVFISEHLWPSGVGTGGSSWCILALQDLW